MNPGRLDVCVPEQGMWNTTFQGRRSDVFASSGINFMPFVSDLFSITVHTGRLLLLSYDRDW